MIPIQCSSPMQRCQGNLCKKKNHKHPLCPPPPLQPTPFQRQKYLFPGERARLVPLNIKPSIASRAGRSHRCVHVVMSSVSRDLVRRVKEYLLVVPALLRPIEFLVHKMQQEVDVQLHIPLEEVHELVCLELRLQQVLDRN
jgi:hypothetical protein